MNAHLGQTPLLQVNGLSKTFGVETVVDRVDLVIQAGMIHALVGQNGSGKSTLIKLLTGYHQPDNEPTASARFNGELVSLDDRSKSGWRRHLHVIHQDLGLVDGLSALENLALDRGYETGRFFNIRWARERRRAAETLERFGMMRDVNSRVEELLPRERAAVAIARAVGTLGTGEPAVLILDEPTATMDDDDAYRVFDAMREAAASGCGILFVSHRLGDIAQVADDVTAIRDGSVTGTREVEGLKEADLVELIVGRKPGDFYTTAPSAAKGRRDIALSVSNLRTEVLDNVSLELRQGEVVGVAGLDGSGRDRLLEALFGEEVVLGGSVSVNGSPSLVKSPHDAMKRGIAFVPGDLRSKGYIHGFNVRENLSLTDLGPFVQKARAIRTGAERAEAEAWIARLSLRPSDPEFDVHLMSGGNAQKVVIAKWLRRRPAVLLLQEPTAGVDIEAKHAIYELVAQAALANTAILLSSSDWRELSEVCDRVLVMQDGRLKTELSGPALTADSIADTCLIRKAS